MQKVGEQLKVSIITVVLNDKSGFSKTMDCIKNLLYSNIEFIVVDGGSTDGTLELVQANTDFISHYISEPDDGIYDAMNKGIDLATGDWLVFLNAGDVFTSNTVLSEIFENETYLNHQLVYGSINVVSEGNKSKYLKSKKLTKLNLVFWGTRVLCHQSLFIKKECAIYYDTRYKIKGDFDWYFSLLNNISTNQIKKMDIPVVNFQLGGISTSKSKAAKSGLSGLNNKEHFDILKRNAGIFFVLAFPAIYYNKLRKKLNSIINA